MTYDVMLLNDITYAQVIRDGDGCGACGSTDRLLYLVCREDAITDELRCADCTPLAWEVLS